ncbi:alpha/beta fold hydrolase [Candidatus Poriferisodalis sp.]|uniref:alpha/beta fold hydrolase n=1 Tax=Candidatus Poriferisodalis sp. TaxID=3101277 RepID=UPI003B524F74
MNDTQALGDDGASRDERDRLDAASGGTQHALAELPTPEAFARVCAADPELALSCRFWNGGIRFGIGEAWLGFAVTDGEIVPKLPAAAGAGIITVTGSPEAWAPLLEVPQPRLARLVPMMALGVLDNSETEQLTLWQYLPALERAAELLRELAGAAISGAAGEADETAGAHSARPSAVAPAANGGDPPSGAGAKDATGDRSAAHVSSLGAPQARHDSPVGRFVHVDLVDPQGRSADYRIYYEEAGSGIPLLAQHTAGAQSLQWRHLFECTDITDRFRLIAYDLPYHGKSLPPQGVPWWHEQYRLEGAFLRQVPLALSAALDLDRPAFVGCSVGGLLALDLALRHPEAFRAVISVGGALHVGGDWEGFAAASHPAVSSNAKARLMESLCGPDAPTPFVKEVSHVYSAAWPPAFWGDLYYYMVEFDLRERAGEIDTGQVGVHILNGEHDWSGLAEYGQAAHEAIAGSTFAVMDGIGHFGMQEHPEAFIPHLLDVLDRIEADSTR